MIKTTVILLVFLFLCSKARAVDEFTGIKCGTDIPKALVGKRMSNEPVATTEARHKDIGLKDLGADEPETGDLVSLIGWQICGNEYQMLVNNKSSVIRDVISIPPRSKDLLEVHGSCQINGKDSPQEIFAVVDNSAGYSLTDKSLAKKMLKAKVAWNIDQPHQRFVPLPAESVACLLDSTFGWNGY